MRKIRRNKYSASAHRASMLRTWINAMKSGNQFAIRDARVRIMGAL